jgi:hypothetical protein
MTGRLTRLPHHRSSVTDARAWRLALVGTTTLLVAALGVAANRDPLREGLTATYFRDANRTSAPVQSTLDARLSTESLLDAWNGQPPATFGTTWTGSIIALRGGTYTFATSSDDGSWVDIDRRPVVDNGGHHSTVLATGSVHLERGVHGIVIGYFQDGGAFNFELSWARNGAPLQPVPAWALSPRRAGFPRFLLSVLIRRGSRAAVWLWLGTIVVAGGAGMGRFLARRVERLTDDPARPVLAGIIGGSLVLNLVGVQWGVPALWAGDEISPTAVFEAFSQHFSGGWFARYPPFHFYVLSAVSSPWLLMNMLGLIHASDAVHYAVPIVLGRLVSVAAGAGVLIGVFLCGARAFGRRAGLFAAAMTALLTPFLYYSKTANPEVPYVFWFTVSLVFYLRLLRTLAPKDAVLFAAAATFAICTKDQAYALYLAAPFVIVYRVWQANRDRRLPHPLARAILDVRVGLAAVTVAVLLILIYDLPFNASGFINHLRDITGKGSQPYRLVEPTLAGRVALLRLTADLNQRSWGWPLWIASWIGLVLAVKERQTRFMAISLALVMVSYYVGFIDVILYNFDRYLLPICVVQAIFGGVALDRVLRWSPGVTRATRTWRMALVAGVFAYTLLYGTTVDVLMHRDSRYAVEQWLRARAGDQLVGTVFPTVVLPRLEAFQSEDIGTIDRLRQRLPAYFILNADYARAVPPDTPVGQLVAGLQQQTLGYRMVFRYRAASPWPWLPAGHPDLVGPRLDVPVFSFLRSINPTIEVYAREPFI